MNNTICHLPHAPDRGALGNPPNLLCPIIAFKKRPSLTAHEGSIAETLAIGRFECLQARLHDLQTCGMGGAEANGVGIETGIEKLVAQHVEWVVAKLMEWELELKTEIEKFSCTTCGMGGGEAKEWELKLETGIEKLVARHVEWVAVKLMEWELKLKAEIENFNCTTLGMGGGET